METEVENDEKDQKAPPLKPLMIRLPLGVKKQVAKKAFERGISTGEYVRGVVAGHEEEAGPWRSEVTRLLGEIRDLLNQALNRRREG